MSVAFLMGVYPTAEGSRGLAYELTSDGTAYILTGIGSCTDTDLKIPNKYRGLPVTEVAGKAFEQNKSIKSLHIPASLRIIRPYAFNGSGLTSVTFEDMTKEWGYYSNPNSVTSAGVLTLATMKDANFVAVSLIGGSASYTWKKK